MNPDLAAVLNGESRGCVVCGDCLEVMRQMPDKCVDLVVTSPPYNMRTRVRNGQYTERETAENFSKKYRFYHDALESGEAIYENTLPKLIWIYRLTSPAAG